MRTMESREDYLESLLVLSRQNGSVRSIDVAAYMNFTKASVSRAISLLKNEKLVRMDDKTGALTLTDAGLAAAEHVYERHLLLTEFLVRLGVPREVAVQDACRMEHVISNDTFSVMKAHLSDAGH
ncbi:MAG: metal-dependent transcriptional regulator [Ruthenibacterium sp.]